MCFFGQRICCFTKLMNCCVGKMKTSLETWQVRKMYNTYRQYLFCNPCTCTENILWPWSEKVCFFKKNISQDQEKERKSDILARMNQPTCSNCIIYLYFFWTVHSLKLFPQRDVFLHIRCHVVLSKVTSTALKYRDSGGTCRHWLDQAYSNCPESTEARCAWDIRFRVRVWKNEKSSKFKELHLWMIAGPRVRLLLRAEINPTPHVAHPVLVCAKKSLLH